ncbi:uncharacterized protein [Nicotiana tomentosiformis]|uniref:uncharacterized protein n=1 Tax=Nicotiana tomentosiformis TaxID=4098 RepID=UPI00388CB676
MSATEDPTEHTLVIADNLGRSGEKEDTSNDEHVAKMAQEMESLRVEVQHIMELAHLDVTTLPQQPRFPSLASLPDHFPSTSCQNNNTPTSATTTQVIPPVTPANPQNPLIHTLYEPQYVQTPQNPPITTNATTPPHDGVTFITNQHIPVVYAAAHERQKKSLQVARGSESLDYEDMCIHPDVDMPAGYKPPKFDIFDGTGDPHAQLRAYCDKLVGVGRNEKLRMKLFIRSLTGEALTWYT